MIEIKFTKEQYENLIKLVYLGNWMINAIHVHGEEHEEYNDLAQHIYFFAKDAGLLDELIEYDKESNKYFPTSKLEEESDAEEFRSDYDDEVFWTELIDRLSKRDFLKEYGEDGIKKMTREERFLKEQPFIDKYEKEFEKNGIENLEIKK